MLKRCVNCGDEFEREIPDNTRESYRRILESVRWCDTCCREAEAEEELERQQAAERGYADRVESRRAACGIPDELRGLTWEDVKDTPPQPLAEAKAWAAGLRHGLVLVGPVGVGKTWLAAAAAWARLEHGPVRWLLVSTLFRLLLLEFGDEGRKAADAALGGSGALVLDDMGQARGKDWAASVLLEAIDRQVTEGRPLLVTSNLGLPELRERFPNGDAITSRLAGYCETFVLEGADRRLQRFAA